MYLGANIDTAKEECKAVAIKSFEPWTRGYAAAAASYASARADELHVVEQEMRGHVCWDPFSAGSATERKAMRMETMTTSSTTTATTKACTASHTTSRISSRKTRSATELQLRLPPRG